MNGRGDCFQIHLDALMLGVQISAPPPIGLTRLDHRHVLVHGTVLHATVPRHWHCWIETADGEWCFDISNGHRAMLTREAYYGAGSVEDVRRYTKAEVVLMAAMHNHCGPWHHAKVDA